MASTFIYSNDAAYKDTSYLSVITFSVVFHVFIFFVVPVLTRMMWNPKKFERPKTFQLVTMPSKLATPVSAKKRKRVKKAKRAVPRSNKNSRPVPVEDELDELEDLLDNIPQPISNISLGKKFPYQWYINNIRTRVESNWKPSISNEELSIVLVFSILANGNISEVSINKSSGTAMLDNLAVRAVKLAAPFGKLPLAYSGNKLELTYTLIPSVK